MSDKTYSRKVFDTAEKYAQMDREAHAKCEAHGPGEKRAACHEKAAKKSAKHRKELREMIDKLNEKLIHFVKKYDEDDITEELRGRMMINAGRYVEDWLSFAKTGSPKMQAKVSLDGVAQFGKKFPKVDWPLYQWKK